MKASLFWIIEHVPLDCMTDQNQYLEYENLYLYIGTENNSMLQNNHLPLYLY